MNLYAVIDLARFNVPYENINFKGLLLHFLYRALYSDFMLEILHKLLLSTAN